MIRSQGTVQVDRPAEEVFAFLADLCNEPRYVSNVIRTEKISEGPLGVGSRYRETARTLLGRRATTTYEISEFDSPRVVEFRGSSGRATFRARWELVWDGGVTKATFTGEAQVGWPMRVLEPILGRSVASTFSLMARNLKRELEQPASVASHSP